MPATALSGAPVLSTARNVSLRGGRDRKMKKPYPCIETKKADPEKRNQIRFFFVGGDDNKSSKYAGAEEGNRIASSYIVMAGDIDPLSGEIITQKMIDEYYKEEDKQIRTNLKFERRGFTNKEQAERRKIKKEFMETFRKEHGHLPSESAVKMYMEEKEGKRWNIMISELVEKGRKDALEDLVESAGGNPLLVAYWFQHDLWRLKERFPDLRVLRSSEDIRDWNAGKIPLAAIHPASTGHGLNLQAGGSTLVWFGLTWSLELYQQTNARLWRQGQKAETVVIHHLVTEGTIDERILQALKCKDQSQDRLIEAVKAELPQSSLASGGAEGARGRPESPRNITDRKAPLEGGVA